MGCGGIGTDSGANTSSYYDETLSDGSQVKIAYDAVKNTTTETYTGADGSVMAMHTSWGDTIAQDIQELNWEEILARRGNGGTLDADATRKGIFAWFMDLFKKDAGDSAAPTPSSSSTTGGSIGDGAPGDWDYAIGGDEPVSNYADDYGIGNSNAGNGPGGIGGSGNGAGGNAGGTNGAGDSGSPDGAGATGGANGFSTTAPNRPYTKAESDKMALQVIDHLMKDFGFTKAQAAGIVGNLYHESAGMNPDVNEFGSGGPDYGAPNGTQFGYGWAQWSGTRKTDFLNWAKENNLDPGSPAANYGFLVHELKTTESDTIAAIKNAKTVDDAAIAFRTVFERAATPNDPSRLADAEAILKAWQAANGGGTAAAA